MVNLNHFLKLIKKVRMVLLVNQSVGNSYSCENFNKIKQDFLEILPKELVVEVFSHLNLATLGTICCVNKAWKRLVNESILWKMAIYKEIAFGNDKWVQCFGTDVVKNEDNKEEFSSLPSDDFIADCKKFKSIFPKKNAKDSLMLVRLPKTLNGGLTLKSLGELAKKYFSASKTGYGCIFPGIIQELGDKSIDKSQWVLMTKDILPGSRDKNYSEQQKIVAELAEKSLISYEIPEVLESTACILSQYFVSNIRLFSDNSKIYIYCKDKIKNIPIVVGGFGLDGLTISFNGCNSTGVTALRKF
jgi:hypothetical protein